MVAACAPGSGDGGQTPGPTATQEPAPSPSPDVSPAENARREAVDFSLVVGPDSVAGWWDGSRWVQADATNAVPAQGGEDYLIVGLDRVAGTDTGSEPAEGCEPVPGSTKIQIPALVRSFADPLEQTRIAVHGVEHPVPREVEQLPASTPYVEAARSLLAERGIDLESPEVLQVVRADLNGDGRDEVAGVAEHLTNPGTLLAEPGDYSIVFVRSVVNEQVVTSVIAETVAEAEPGVSPFVQSHRVAAVADLNGDGVMELAVAGKYYEGASVVFYELGGDGRMHRILSSGCGA